jgi:hypothetical protein
MDDLITIVYKEDWFDSNRFMAEHLNNLINNNSGKYKSILKTKAEYDVSDAVSNFEEDLWGRRSSKPIIFTNVDSSYTYNPLKEKITWSTVDKDLIDKIVWYEDFESLGYGMKYGWHEKQAVLLAKAIAPDADFCFRLLTLLFANAMEALLREIEASSSKLVEVPLWPKNDRDVLEKIMNDLEKKEKKVSKEWYLAGKTSTEILRYQQIYVASQFYTKALDDFMGIK